MQDHAHEKREYDRNRSEDPQDGVAPGLDRGPVADDSSEGQKEEEGPVYLHVYAGGPADLESVAHGAACNPSFYENASMRTLPTTEVIPHPRGPVVIPFTTTGPVRISPWKNASQTIRSSPTPPTSPPSRRPSERPKPWEWTPRPRASLPATAGYASCSSPLPTRPSSWTCSKPATSRRSRRCSKRG